MLRGDCPPVCEVSIISNMRDNGSTEQLILQATAGDRAALEQLLLEHYTRLSRRVAQELAGPLGRLVSVEDILQETFIQAIRDIKKCDARSPGSFAAWLSTIADNRLRDTRKELRRKRRGGGRRRVGEPPASRASTIANLVELIADPGDTPSRPIARQEAVQAIQVGLAGLPADQREAIRLRYLGRKTIDRIVVGMDRTAAAVRRPLHRAKKALREALGHSSLWFSRK
jgi:RNA polymerase sigma-70 factor (subfamily 1)